MHRSGTSATAAMCQAAGLFIGDRLIEGAPSNPDGHFEDIDFHLLTRAIIADNGYPDNGFVSDVQVAVSADRQKQVESLLARRRALRVPWGWKDPRAVLLLDFWAEVLPEARFLFVFRAPWQVMDSLYRRGDLACQDDPMLALRVWTHYNRIILDFARRRGPRSILLEFAQLAKAPGPSMQSVGRLVGTELQGPVNTFRPELISLASDEGRVALVHALSPETTQIYAQMCAMSGSGSAVAAQPTERGLTRVLEQCLGQWAVTSASRGLAHAQ
jgi:hypothetical protein